MQEAGGSDNACSKFWLILCRKLLKSEVGSVMGRPSCRRRPLKCPRFEQIGGRTALHLAALKQEIEEVEHLLANGVAIETTDREGQGPRVSADWRIKGERLKPLDACWNTVDAVAIFEEIEKLLKCKHWFKCCGEGPKKSE